MENWYDFDIKGDWIAALVQLNSVMKSWWYVSSISLSHPFPSKSSLSPSISAPLCQQTPRTLPKVQRCSVLGRNMVSGSLCVLPSVAGMCVYTQLQHRDNTYTKTQPMTYVSHSGTCRTRADSFCSLLPPPSGIYGVHTMFQAAGPLTRSSSYNPTLALAPSFSPGKT